jgi:hypothetical protein
MKKVCEVTRREKRKMLEIFMSSISLIDTYHSGHGGKTLLIVDNKVDNMALCL